MELISVLCGFGVAYCTILLIGIIKDKIQRRKDRKSWKELQKQYPYKAHIGRINGTVYFEENIFGAGKKPISRGYGKPLDLSNLNDNFGE